MARPALRRMSPQELLRLSCAKHPTAETSNITRVNNFFFIPLQRYATSFCCISSSKKATTLCHGSNYRESIAN